MLTAGGRPRHGKSTLECCGEDTYAGKVFNLNCFLWPAWIGWVLVYTCDGLQIFDIFERVFGFMLSALFSNWCVVVQEDIDKLLTSQLGPRERDIVRLHYGVGRQDGYPMSLETISHRWSPLPHRSCSFVLSYQKHLSSWWKLLLFLWLSVSLGPSTSCLFCRASNT